MFFWKKEIKIQKMAQISVYVLKNLGEKKSGVFGVLG